LVNGEVNEEGFDLRRTRLAGVSFIVEQDVALDPVHVGSFGVDGLVRKDPRCLCARRETVGGALWQVPRAHRRRRTASVLALPQE